MLAQSTAPPKKCLTTTEKAGRTLCLGITPDSHFLRHHMVMVVA